MKNITKHEQAYRERIQAMLLQDLFEEYVGLVGCHEYSRYRFVVLDVLRSRLAELRGSEMGMTNWKQVFRGRVQAMTLDELFEEYVRLFEEYVSLSEPERNDYDGACFFREEAAAEIRARLATLKKGSDHD